MNLIPGQVGLAARGDIMMTGVADTSTTDSTTCRTPRATDQARPVARDSTLTDSQAIVVMLDSGTMVATTHQMP